MNLVCKHRANMNYKIPSLKNDTISSGVINLFHSWVPWGTRFKRYSAAMIPSAHDAVVRLRVVKNIEPPGFENGRSRVWNLISWEQICIKPYLEQVTATMNEEWGVFYMFNDFWSSDSIKSCVWVIFLIIFYCSYFICDISTQPNFIWVEFGGCNAFFTRIQSNNLCPQSCKAFTEQTTTTTNIQNWAVS